MTQTCSGLPERLRDDVQRLGRAEHKAVSDIVRESLRRHVAVQRFRAVRRKVLPFAEAQGLVTDEDVFEVIVSDELVQVVREKLLGKLKVSPTVAAEFCQLLLDDGRLVQAGYVPFKGTRIVTPREFWDCVRGG